MPEIAKRGKITLEPLQSPERILKAMVELYLDEYGYGDLYDVYKVLLPIKPEEIGAQFFSAIEDINESEMLQNGLCPDCAEELQLRITPATRTEPMEQWCECPECHRESLRS